MNEATQPAIEPVTDEDVSVAVKVGEMVVAPFVQQALEQDRRRVAERQAERHSVGSTLRHTNVARLRELSHAVTQGPDAIRRECSMRVPAEPDRDADLVLSSAADEIERLRAEVAKLRAACAAMQERCARACEDEARIWEADGKGPECAARLCAARIRSLPNVTDAGKGWIDASGAVEARLHCEYGDPSVGVGDHWFLTDNDMDYTWAGSKVKIVRVKP